MKYIVSLLVLFSIGMSAQAGVIVVEGKYQNKNVYIQNSYADLGVGFSVYAVYVNDILTNDEVNSTAFEIDLAQLKLKYGQDVTIKILHKDTYNLPHVINPDALKPMPSFDIVSMNMTNEDLLTWTTKNESSPIPYTIEQFRWNKWISVGEVDGIGSPGEHNYKFKVTAMHSGENKFRLKQSGYRSKYSQEIRITSSAPRCIFSLSKATKQINFTCGTMYEIYDYYGTVVKRGYGSKVDIANLHKGNYYICYDNTIGELKRK